MENRGPAVKKEMRYSPSSGGVPSTKSSKYQLMLILDEPYKQISDFHVPEFDWRKTLKNTQSKEKNVNVSIKVGFLST